MSVRGPPLGPVLGPYWAILGAFWLVLAPTWAILGASWERLGLFWDGLRGLLGRLPSRGRDVKKAEGRMKEDRVARSDGQ